MTTTRRLFWAIELPAPVRGRLARIQALLAESAPAVRVRWTPKHQLHLTLKFLGDTALDPAALVAAAAAVVPPAPLALEIAGLGSFGGRRPRVVWAGVGGAGREALIGLVRELERAMTPLGFTPEGRAYAPHVTLGRVRRTQGKPGPNQLPAALQALAHPPLEFRASELVLFASSFGKGSGRVVHSAEARLELPD